MKTAFALLAVFLSFGCANAAVQQAQARIAASTPTCSESVPTQCEKMWEAAQVWIVQNSAYKLQIATNIVLETFNPPQYQTGIAVRVLKEPTGNGQHKFVVTVWCANIFGCRPNQFDAALDFNRYVTASKI